MYESPITMIQKTISEQMRQEEDKYIYEIEQQVGFRIDKQELIRALNYDRDQYYKGFNDANKLFVRSGHWVEWNETVERFDFIFGSRTEEILRCKCSECEKEIIPEEVTSFKYCPFCGAKMEDE